MGFLVDLLDVNYFVAGVDCSGFDLVIVIVVIAVEIAFSNWFCSSF
ncbi:hypothetical protein L9G16_22245 [Shewanella sp. A25]|nr:hypothetical protein [Shewanella shenzhenensis]